MLSRIVLSVALLGGALMAQSTDYRYDAAGRLASVVLPGGKTMSYTYDAAGNLIQRVIGTTGTVAPTAPAAGVVNAASFQGGPVAPGELVTIFGAGVGPANLAGLALTGYGYVDSYIGETRVLFDGVPSPLVYAFAGQTTAIVPYSVAGKASTQMTVVYRGRSSAPATLAVAAAAPALFSADSSGKGNGAILNQDSSVNSAANPADQGSVVVLFGTGEGQTDPRGADGRVASGVFPKPVLPLSVTIGGQPAEVLYYGAAPALVSGVLQINARIPAGIASGAAEAIVTVGSFSSPAGLTVSVK
jgi:uncharacterized protein (TIGR03437 family)